MPRVVSIHEYILKPETDQRRFEQAIITARTSGLLRLPGLVDCHMVKGIGGVRNGLYAAAWIYESREAWERLW